eukprot:COSAG01_NODE_2339_length_7871_cov_114.127123_3_plen_760_part_00
MMAHVQDPKKREQAASAAKGPAKRPRTVAAVAPTEQPAATSPLEASPLAAAAGAPTADLGRKQPTADGSPPKRQGPFLTERKILKKMMSKALPGFDRPFKEVWPKRWEDYQLRIREPMDFGTIRRKLKEGAYTTAPDHAVHPDFIADMQLVYTNCMDYNEVGSEYHRHAEKMLAKFLQKVEEEKSKRQRSPVVQEPTAPSSLSSFAAKQAAVVPTEQQGGATAKRTSRALILAGRDKLKREKDKLEQENSELRKTIKDLRKNEQQQVAEVKGLEKQLELVPRLLHGITPMHEQVVQGEFTEVNRRIDFWQTADSIGRTPFMLAGMRNHKAFHDLIKVGELRIRPEDLQVVDCRGYSILHYWTGENLELLYAYRRDLREVLESLVKKAIPYKEPFTPLGYVLCPNYSYHKSPHPYESVGWSEKKWRVSENDISPVQSQRPFEGGEYLSVKTKVAFLLRLGDDPNGVRCGFPILFSAIWRCIGKHEPLGIVKLLLDSKADVRYKYKCDRRSRTEDSYNDGRTPLIEATFHSKLHREDLCRLLLDYGAKKKDGLCQKCDLSRPYAFDFDDHEQFKTGPNLQTYLITLTGNPDAPQLAGYQLLCPQRKRDEIELILEQNADPNITDEQGRTPLFYATGDGAKLLMQNGADPCACDNNGFSAISFNRGLGAVQAMLRHNAEVVVQRCRIDLSDPYTWYPFCSVDPESKIISNAKTPVNLTLYPHEIQVFFASLGPEWYMMNVEELADTIIELPGGWLYEEDAVN